MLDKVEEQQEGRAPGLEGGKEQWGMKGRRLGLAARSEFGFMHSD